MSEPVDPTRRPRPLAASLEPERQQTVARLQAAFAEDRMTLEELDERLELAESARTGAELAVLTQDLPALTAAPPSRALAVPTEAPASKSLVAIFSGVERHGAWAVPQRLKVTAVFGGAQLDFRDATFQPGVTELTVSAVFGGVEVLVPPDIRVESDGVGIFGGFEDLHQSAPDPDAPTLRIRGRAIFGGVGVHARPLRRRLT